MKAGVVVTAIALQFACAGLGMLALGVAHGFDSRVPALGYWTCFFLMLALRMFGPVTTRKTAKS